MIDLMGLDEAFLTVYLLLKKVCDSAAFFWLIRSKILRHEAVALVLRLELSRELTDWDPDSVYCTCVLTSVCHLLKILC